MATVSANDERKELKEDIERIKVALQDCGDDIEYDLPLSVRVEDSDSDPESEVGWTKFSVCSDVGDANYPENKVFLIKNEKEKLPSSVKDQAQADAEYDDSSLAYLDPSLEQPEAPGQGSEEITQMCVALNKAYQELITEDLELIEQLLTQNREHQKELHQKIYTEAEEKKSDPNQTKRKLSSYCVPYFKDKYNNPPPLNEDAKVLQASGDVSVFIRPLRTWHLHERKKLTNAVNADLLKQRLQPLMNRLELQLEKLETATKEQHQILTDNVKEMQNKIKNLKHSALDIDEKTFKSIDWMKISTVDFDGLKTPDECMRFWQNALHPAIAKGKWTKEEDTRLRDVAKENNQRDWQKIATDLKTNRSAFQCFERYQTKLNPCLKTGRWSPEEDSILVQIVNRVAVGETIPWEQVSYYMEGRSNEQCMNRWRQLNVPRNRGKWTTEEDEQLLKAVKRYGTNCWVRLQACVPTRTPQQCRERYGTALNKTVKVGIWSYVEDKLLWLLADTYQDNEGPIQWSKIAANIPGRTDNACLQRHRVLCRYKEVESMIHDIGGTELVNLLDEIRKRLSKSEEVRQETTKSICDNKKQIMDCDVYLAQLKKELDLRLVNTDVKSKREGKKIKIIEEQIEIFKNKKIKLQSMIQKLEPTSEDEEEIMKKLTEDDIRSEDRRRGMEIPQLLFPGRGMRMTANNQMVYKRLKNLLRNLPDSGERTKLAELMNLDLLELKQGKHKITMPKLSDAEPEPEPEPEVEPEEEEEVVIKVEKKPRVARSSAQQSATRVAATRRSMKTEEDFEVERQIALIIRQKEGMRKVGRPKLNNDTEGSVPKEDIQHLEEKVLKLMSAALNMDVPGCVQQYRNFRKDVESSSKTLEDRGMFRTLYHQELKNMVVPASATAQSNKKLVRRALEGEVADKAYQLPPLPPMTATLNAFRMLLLCRRDLLHASRKRNKPYTTTAKRKTDDSQKAAEDQCVPEKRPRLDSSQQEDTGGDISVDMDHSGMNLGSPDRVGVSNPAGSGSDRDAIMVNGVTADTTYEASKTDALSSSKLNSTADSSVDLNSSDAGGASTPSHTSDSKQKSDSNEPNVINKNSKIVVLRGPSAIKQEKIMKVLKEKGMLANNQKVVLKYVTREQLQESASAIKHLNDSEPESALAASQTVSVKKAVDILHQTHDYQLLKARFSSLFLWPGLLSTLCVEDEMEAARVAKDMVKQAVKQAVVEKQPLGRGQEWHDKKSKKSKTVRNRYPCSKGSRFKKMSVVPREVKSQLLEHFNQGRKNRKRGKKQVASSEPEQQQQQESELGGNNISESVTMEEHTPVNITHTPVNITHTPVNITHTPVNITHTPVNITHTPVNITPTPVNITPDDWPVTSSHHDDQALNNINRTAADSPQEEMEVENAETSQLEDSKCHILPVEEVEEEVEVEVAVADVKVENAETSQLEDSKFHVLLEEEEEEEEELEDVKPNIVEISDAEDYVEDYVSDYVSDYVESDQSEQDTAESEYEEEVIMHRPTTVKIDLNTCQWYQFPKKKSTNTSDISQTMVGRSVSHDLARKSPLQSNKDQDQTGDKPSTWTEVRPSQPPQVLSEHPGVKSEKL